MLLRSVTEHVRTQNWFAVGVDLVIVVFGVYIGIQVSNWNEAFLENQRGEYFAERLREDLRKEFEIYENEDSYYSSVHEYALRAIDLVDNDDPAFDNEFVVSAYNATQFYHGQSARSTFDELVATGNLYLLKDDNLRNTALFLYNTVVRERLSSYVFDSDYRERVRRIIPYDVQVAIREQCGDIIDGNTGFSTGIHSDCKIDFAEDRIAAAAAVLRDDSAFRSDLAFLLSSFGYFISDTAAARLQAEQRLNGTFTDSAPR